jgi:hypothetical protein
VSEQIHPGTTHDMDLSMEGLTTLLERHSRVVSFETPSFKLGRGVSSTTVILKRFSHSKAGEPVILCLPAPIMTRCTPAVLPLIGHLILENKPVSFDRNLPIPAI